MEELREALVEAIQLSLPEGIAFENPTWEPLGDPNTSDSVDSSVRSQREMLICA
jgi:hypothetical protein